MNNLKFRAWHPSSKNMVFIDPNSAPNDEYQALHFWHLLGNFHPEGEDLLMRSTGLSDANGVEIFEGDILRKDPINTDWVDVKIEWHKEKASFVYVHIYNKYEYGYMGDRGYSDYIVIGNIYENPELLARM